MKRILAIALAAALSFSLAACGNKDDQKSSAAASSQTAATGGEVKEAAKTSEELISEKYAEPVKVKAVLSYRDSENPNTPDSVTPETSTMVKLLKEKLNIDLEYSWIVNSDQYTSKFNAELAAGNLPDVMMLSPNMFEDLYSQGGLGDLTEAYDKYSNSSTNGIFNYDGKIIEAGKKDGKIFGLPNSTYPAQVTSQIYYDMSKLKEAGITAFDQLPKTIPEFEALCNKLMTIDIDKNGKTGEPVFAANKWYIDAGLADFSPVFHAYETTAGGWYDDGAGKLVNGVVQPGLKEPLTKLNEWYKKGYFAKDFAAQDVWGANAPCVSDIVAGKYAIVMGSWWIPNWPLNDHKKNHPDADWVVGPTLTKDGTLPKIFVPRYPVDQFTVVSKDFKHPEAIFKMVNLQLEYEKKINNPDFLKNATEAEKLESYGYVYIWMPYRIYNPNSLVDNFNFIRDMDSKGTTEIDPATVPNNSEFWGAWNSYLETKKGSKDATIWGLYTSRLAPNGGVAHMYDLYQKAEKKYNEVYVTTPSMVTKSSELNKYRDKSFLSMIMGETPVSDFDKFVTEWYKLGGADIEKEVNDWYKKK